MDHGYLPQPGSGGNIPSNVIEGNDVVTIKHNVTYNVGDDLFVDKNGSIGTLEIIGGSLVLSQFIRRWLWEKCKNRLQRRF